MYPLSIFDLGKVDYQPTWELQRELQSKLITQKKMGDSEEAPSPYTDTLLLVEHPHVYTLGKSGDEDHLLRSNHELTAIDATFVKVDRGGDITYHGPGQLVGYPILDLDHHFHDIHRYLRFLEEIIILTLADFGIQGSRKDKWTGVWVGEEKICAMGIKCSRWVTMHGFALNINADLSYFGHIIPCGIQEKGVTSMSQLLGNEISRSDVIERIIHHFSAKFSYVPYRPARIEDVFGNLSSSTVHTFAVSSSV